MVPLSPLRWRQHASLPKALRRLLPSAPALSTRPRCASQRCRRAHSAGASEFHSLRGRAASARTAVLLSSGGVRQPLIERLEPLFNAVMPDALGLVRANQAARRVLSDEAWPALVSADFGGGKAPRIGCLNIDMVTMSAREWLDEAHRVLVRGETLSKMSHCPLCFNFKVFLAVMMPLAAAAVEAGLPDELRRAPTTSGRSCALRAASASGCATT